MNSSLTRAILSNSILVTHVLAKKKQTAGDDDDGGGG